MNDIGDTVELVGDFRPGSDEWHLARGKGLGGSEIAAVLGLSPWQSRFSLWHYKAGLLAPERIESASLEWGTRLEDVVFGKFAEDHPEFMHWNPGTYRSKARSWQIANPDRILVRPDSTYAIYEGKTADKMDGWEWGEPGSDEIPVYYRCQGLWYLDTFGFETCHFGVLIGGNDYREYVLRYDAAEAQLMREAGAEFMQSIAENVRPEIDSSESTYQAVRQLHPDVDGSEIEIAVDDANAYTEACLDYKAAESAKRQASAAVLDAMGAATYATVDGHRFAMRVAVNGRVPHLRPTPNRREKKAA